LYSQIILLCVLLITLLAQTAAPVRAQTQDLATPVALAVVIDNSTSMDQNDPNRLSFAATRLLYEAADSNDQISVVCFGSSHATMLPLTTVGDATARRTVTAQLTQGACPVGGGTVIGPAIDEAVATLANAASTRRYILLLTDGEPNDLNETLAAVDRAQQQQIPIISLSLYPGPLSNKARQFQDQLRQRRLDPRTVTNPQDLIAEFATVYAQLKPDRHVTRLGLGEPGEMRINALQQVNRVLFVLGPNQAINENDREINCATNAARCIPDVEGKFSLLSVDATPVDGIWRLRSPNENAVAITRANFRPRLAYPPIGDTAQPGYFLPGRASPLIIADLEGAIADDAPVTINGHTGQRAPGVGQTFIFAGVPTLQTADVRLGSGDVPLVLNKAFTLLPVPDPEVDLPRLEPANPDANGQITLANDSQFTLAARITGDRALTPQLTVRAVIFDGATGDVLYGPTLLFSRDDLYQSTELIDIQPGISYRTVIWLEAVRGRDQLRYGDQITLDLRASGGVVVNGLPSQRIENFDGRAIPITVDVTEANTTVGLSAQLEWNAGAYPAGVNVNSLFRAQLADSQFNGQGNNTTIELYGPEDLCDLPEGDYEAAIVFTSSSGLPVSPSRIPVSGRISYGDVTILTTTPVDLGRYCSLPGFLNVFCLPVGSNEEREPGSVELRVPGCLKNTNIATNLQIDDDPDTTIKIGALNRTGEDATLTFVMDTVAPQNVLRDFAVRRDFTGDLLISRRDAPERADSVNVTYSKFSTLDVFWPGIERWGNLAGLTSAVIFGTAFLIGTYRLIFGQTSVQIKTQQERENRKTEQFIRTRRGRQVSRDEDERRRKLNGNPPRDPRRERSGLRSSGKAEPLRESASRPRRDPRRERSGLRSSTGSSTRSSSRSRR
jgi:uncharacterized protein YegL